MYTDSICNIWFYDRESSFNYVGELIFKEGYRNLPIFKQVVFVVDLPSTESRRNIRLRPNQDRFNSSTLGLLSNVLSSRIMSSSSAVVLQININIPVCVICSYTSDLIGSDVVCKVCKVNQDENAFDYLVFINETFLVGFLFLLLEPF